MCLIVPDQHVAQFQNCLVQLRLELPEEHHHQQVQSTVDPVQLPGPHQSHLGRKPQTSAQSTGNDILFTTSDGITKIPHEIESYSSGALTAWVNVPSVSSTDNTTLYMYYGNASSTSQQNVNGVWDSNFKAVWHLNNIFTDSTSNAINGINVGSTDIAGIIAQGRSFDGSSKYIDMQKSTALQPSQLTFSFWYNRGSTSLSSSTGRIFWAKSTSSWDAASGWMVDVNDVASPSQPINLVVDGSGGFAVSGISANTFYPENTWTYLVITFDSTSNAGKAYKNAISQTFSSFGSPDAISTSATNKTLATGGGSYMPGSFDEVRISSNVRSADWILTGYNNQNSPPTFYTVGSRQ